MCFDFDFELPEDFIESDHSTPVQLELPIILPMPAPSVCECGAEKIKAPVHSNWCPKYKKEEE